MTTYPPRLTVRQALNEFYDTHDFGREGGVDEPVVRFKFGPVAVVLPNTEQRKQVIWLHDLHHLLNEYPTTWPGEGRVSAWELVTGGWGGQLYIWSLILSAFTIGGLLYPAGAFRAFVWGTYCRPVLSLGLSKAELLSRLGIDLSDAYPVRLSHYVRFAALLYGYVGLWVAGGVLLIRAIW